MFDEMVGAIREDAVRLLLTVQIRREEEPVREPVSPVQNTQHVGTPTSGTDNGPVKNKPIHVGKKPGRNDPCPCGSGKKYKNCCGRDD